MKPPLTPLDSSVLTGHAYDPDTRTLHLGFKSGDTWEYRDVPLEKVEALIGNASPGQYFGSKIRGHYAGRKL